MKLTRIGITVVLLTSVSGVVLGANCKTPCNSFVTEDLAPWRFTVVDPTTCSFSPNGLCPNGCTCMQVAADWNHSPYVFNGAITRAVIPVHASGENAMYAMLAVQKAADQLGLDPSEMLILAPQFALKDDVDGELCLIDIAECHGGARDGMLCTSELDCVSPEIAYWASSWRYGNDSCLGWEVDDGPKNCTGEDSAQRPFRISSYEVIDQMIKQLALRYPTLEQVVVVGHSAGAQVTNRYAAGSPVEDTILEPQGISIRYVLSGPGRVLYFDDARWDGVSFDPRGFETPMSCPGFSDCDISEYDKYVGSRTLGFGLEDIPDDHYMNPLEGLSLADQPYRNREVAYLVGEDDTCPYVRDTPCPVNFPCTDCLDTCPLPGCGSDCGPPPCGTALQGFDHVESMWNYKDYLAFHAFGPQILGRQRFEIVPDAFHSTCCSYLSDNGKKYLFDIKKVYDGFDAPDGPVGGDWLDSPDNRGGDLEIVGGEVASTVNVSNLAGIYRPVALDDPLRIRALLRETDGPDLTGSRFAHHFAVNSDGSMAGGYGIGVERSGATATDSRVTLYDNGATIGSITSTFQFESSLELEFAIFADGRVEGTLVEGADTFDFSFGPRTIESSRDMFVYHTAWDAPGSTLAPRMDHLMITALPTPVATPPAAPDSMTVRKLDPAGDGLSIEWDTACPSAHDYHLVFGGGSQLPAAPGRGFALTGSECGLGDAGAFVWNGSPSPTSDPTGLIWWLLLANDGATTEGSWGVDGAGSERLGPAAGGSSGKCGISIKDTANPCGR